jgi:hypothetical protein
MLLILVVNCSFYCSNLVSYFLRSVGFFIIIIIPEKKIICLQIIHEQFEIKLEAISFAHSIFLIQDRRQIIMEYPKEQGTLLNMPFS